eukprot:jgi/Chlat1/8615/Chrsp86S08024
MASSSSSLSAAASLLVLLLASLHTNPADAICLGVLEHIVIHLEIGNGVPSVVSQPAPTPSGIGGEVVASIFNFQLNQLNPFRLGSNGYVLAGGVCSLPQSNILDAQCLLYMVTMGNFAVGMPGGLCDRIKAGISRIVLNGPDRKCLAYVEGDITLIISASKKPLPQQRCNLSKTLPTSTVDKLVLVNAINALVLPTGGLPTGGLPTLP